MRHTNDNTGFSGAEQEFIRAWKEILKSPTDWSTAGMASGTSSWYSWRKWMDDEKPTIELLRKAIYSFPDNDCPKLSTFKRVYYSLRDKIRYGEESGNTTCHRCMNTGIVILAYVTYMEGTKKVVLRVGEPIPSPTVYTVGIPCVCGVGALTNDIKGTPGGISPHTQYSGDKLAKLLPYAMTSAQVHAITGDCIAMFNAKMQETGMDKGRLLRELSKQAVSSVDEKTASWAGDF